MPYTKVISALKGSTWLFSKWLVDCFLCGIRRRDVNLSTTNDSPSSYIGMSASCVVYYPPLLGAVRFKVTPRYKGEKWNTLP